MGMTRPRFLFLLSLSLLSMAAGYPQIAPTATGVARGTVTLRDTGAPARGAVVFLRPVETAPVPGGGSGEFVVREDERANDLHATVDRNGAFSIDRVPSGDYTLNIYKPGYFDQDAALISVAAFSDWTRRVHLARGEKKVIAIRLERGGAIEGQVRFSDKKPAHTGGPAADEVAVNVEIQTVSGALNRFGEVAHTDAEGHYRIEGLPAGRYAVFAGFPGKMVETTHGMEEADGRILFAPGVIRASKAELVEVDPPHTRDGVDITVPLQGLHRIVGKVIDSSGVTVTRGLIRLYPSGEPAMNLTSPVGRNGEFSFGDLPNDDYTVSFESQSEAEFLGITEDKTGIRMRMRKAPYAPTSKQVIISGRDATDVVLTVRPML